MERIKRFTWPSACIVIAIAFYLHYWLTGNKDRTALKVFGEYTAGDIALDLNTNGSYRMIKNQTVVMSQGKFEIRKDTILLCDMGRAKNVLLKFENEEILTALELDGIENTKFYCWLKFYPDNKVYFSGAWDHAKKHGVWQYFTPDQQRIQMTLYERGEVKDANFRFDFTLPDSVSAK